MAVMMAIMVVLMVFGAHHGVRDEHKRDGAPPAVAQQQDKQPQAEPAAK